MGLCSNFVKQINLKGLLFTESRMARLSHHHSCRDAFKTLAILRFLFVYILEVTLVLLFLRDHWLNIMILMCIHTRGKYDFCTFFYKQTSQRV